MIEIWSFALFVVVMINVLVNKTADNYKITDIVYVLHHYSFPNNFVPLVKSIVNNSTKTE